MSLILNELVLLDKYCLIWNCFFQIPKSQKLRLFLIKKLILLMISRNFSRNFSIKNNLSYCFETERRLDWPVIIQNFVSNNWCKNVILELARLRIISISQWNWYQNIITLVSASTALQSRQRKIFEFLFVLDFERILSQLYFIVILSPSYCELFLRLSNFFFYY